MSETPRTSRPEKTPAEVNAQVGRIATKLIERAQKLDMADQPIQPAPIHAPKYSPMTTIRTIDGKLQDATLNDAEMKHIFLSHGHNGNETIVSHTTTSATDDQNRFTSKDIELKFTPDGSSGTYRNDLLSTDEDMRYVSRETTELPAAGNPDTAAKILMQARGVIAGQEIAENQARVEAQAAAQTAAQAEVNQLLK